MKYRSHYDARISSIGLSVVLRKPRIHMHWGLQKMYFYL